MHISFIVLRLICDSLLISATEPWKPGKIISNLSNFSADGIHLVWEESDAFVNGYRVEIDGYLQTTLGSKPEIDWNRLLLPVTQYKVKITAISYGYVTNYPSYGRKESQPAANWIMTTECKPTSPLELKQYYYGKLRTLLVYDSIIILASDLFSPNTHEKRCRLSTLGITNGIIIKKNLHSKTLSFKQRNKTYIYVFCIYNFKN